MLLVACGCVVPLLLVAIVVAVLDRGGTRSTGTQRWDALAEEIARRGDQRPHPRSDRAARRHHLASVFPADARR